MNAPKVVLDTDAVVDFLTRRESAAGRRGPSLMRRLLGVCICYTTVFNAAELFALAHTRKEREVVEGALSCIKLLGLNARSAPAIGVLLRQSASRQSGDLPVLIGALCRQSRLPLVTYRPEAFRGISGLSVLPAVRLSRLGSEEELRRACGHVRR